MIESFCPHCRKQLKLKEEHLGTAIRCPLCRETFRAVTSQQDNRENAADPKPKAKVSRKDRPPRDNWVMLVLGVLFTLGGFGASMTNTVTATPAVIALCGLVMIYGATIEGHLDRISFYLKRADKRAEDDET